MKVFLIIMTLANGASWDQAKMQSRAMPDLATCMGEARMVLVRGVPKDGSLLAAGCAVTGAR